MKRLAISLLLLAIMPILTYGETLHAIIFANTQNNSIGQSVEVDFKRMELEMTTIAKSIGYGIKKYNYYGSPSIFNRKSLESVINNLSCSPNDIVIFYYSGHGGRAMNEKTDFPEMCLFANDADFISTELSLYPLYDVYTRIKAKRPRLTIVMGDLCNSVAQGYYRDNSRSATIMSKGTCDVYKNLFLNVKGGLIAASSKPGQPSGCYQFVDNGTLYDAGGFFTHSFLCALQYFVGQGKAVSWKYLFDNTIDLTQELSENRKQTPIYQLDVTTVAPQASQTTNSTPQQPVTTNDAATNQRDKLAYSLSLICNQNISKLDRIRNIEKAKTYFPDLRIKVQVVGCDGKTVVNTCSIENYLNYLSIATKMDQVVVLDIKNNTSGKPNYLKVHEIHYQ